MRTIPIPAALIEPLVAGAFDGMWDAAGQVVSIAESRERAIGDVVAPIERIVRQRALAEALESLPRTGGSLGVDRLPALIEAHGHAQETAQDVQGAEWRSIGVALEQLGATLASEHYGQVEREAGGDTQ